jgi:Ferritin-like
MTRRSRFRGIVWKRHTESARPFSERMRDLVFEKAPAAIGIETDSAKRKRTSPLRQAMLDAVPWVEASSAIDEARQLLEAAAEIEHALLVEYLYAAMSLKPHAVRKTVIDIAIQEMSHLLTVQNLLLFVGAKPYLERFDVSPNPGVDPFPFQLKGIQNRETLERFVLAEMPILDSLSLDDRTRINEIKQRLDPNGTFNRVGVLYARIYWLFQSGSAPEGEWKDVSNIADIGPLPQWHISDFPGVHSVSTTQASRDEIGLISSGQQGEIWHQDQSGGGAFGVIGSREDALRVIYSIASQGEGLVGSGGDSHFEIFFNTLKDFDSLPSGRMLPVPDNPSIKAGTGQTMISNQTTNVLAQFLNTRYQIMLVALTAALNLNRTDNSENLLRQKYVSWSFFEMMTSTRSIATEIVKHPCVAGGDASALCGGPTFELESVQLEGSLSDLQKELISLHLQAQNLIGVLKGMGYGTNGDFLAVILNEDGKRYQSV